MFKKGLCLDNNVRRIACTVHALVMIITYLKRAVYFIQVSFYLVGSSPSSEVCCHGDLRKDSLTSFGGQGSGRSTWLPIRRYLHTSPTCLWRDCARPEALCATFNFAGNYLSNNETTCTFGWPKFHAPVLFVGYVLISIVLGHRDVALGFQTFDYFHIRVRGFACSLLKVTIQ